MTIILNQNIDNSNRDLIDRLEESLRTSSVNIYKTYAGFPVLKGGKYSEKYVVDYAIITHKALYVCNFSNDELALIKNFQDNIYNIMESVFRKTPSTVVGRKLICDIFPVTISSKNIMLQDDQYHCFSAIENLIEFINENEKKLEELEISKLRKINSAIQGAYGTVKREKRVVANGTKSAIINEINDYIETYDDNQFSAITSDVKGIQRIRGMAGSGKTIVLARKAAQLHLDYPDWNIVVTYSTRSQKNQLEKLIRDYYDRLSDGDSIDEDKIRVMHAWGSATANGLYYEICLHNELQPLNYGQAKSLFHSSKDIYEKVCERVLNSTTSLKKEYDCILVDEAQDFKRSFFKLCLKVVKDDRIVYAYDELQNLGGESMDSPSKLFGKKISHDTPLRVCYRNQKKVIVTAHALGMGIYTGSLPIQMPSTLDVWDSIGYNCEGELAYGNDVVLYRSNDTSPTILKIDGDPITFNKFENFDDSIEYLMSCIEKNIQTDKLLLKDIMIIDLDTLNAESNSALLRSKGSSISYHYAGKSNPEEFFRDDSIVYSSIFRAKGNEAYIVYILNAQKVISAIDNVTLRNALFTAMTRSKGWVEVIGCGDAMDSLIQEYNTVKSNQYKLIFSPYPTKEELKKIKTYSNDITKTESDALQRTRDTIKKLLSENKREPLMVAQDLFDVHTKEELIKLLLGESQNGEN
mgnify:CR=1 FL=1